MIFVIMRHPVLPEDEGRHAFIMVCRTKEEAVNWVRAQRDEYFKPEDYYIAVGPTK